MNSYGRSAMIYLEEIKEEKRLYSFGIPVGSPYEEVYAVCEEFKNHVKNMEEEAKKRAEEEAQKESEEPKKDEESK